MTLDEIRKVLEEKCLAHTEENIYTYDNVKFMVESYAKKIVKADKVEIEVKNLISVDPLDYLGKYAIFYFNDEKVYEINIYNLLNLSYVEKKVNKEEPITIEQTLDKFYEELIKPFIIRVAKDIYKEIKNDKS